MTISNHLITGAAIGLAIQQPVIALPLAFVSHFVIDGLPHYGYPSKDGYHELFKHKLTFFVLGLDIIGIIVLLMVLGAASYLVWAAAMVALSPDFAWLYHYVRYERRGDEPPNSRLTRFHQWLQWGERPWGFIIEIAFFVLMLTVI